MFFSGMSAAEVEPNSLQQPIKFADVQGVDEAKHELEEVVQFLKEPKKFMEIGGKLPKGLFLSCIYVIPKPRRYPH